MHDSGLRCSSVSQNQNCGETEPIHGAGDRHMTRLSPLQVVGIGTKPPTALDASAGHQRAAGPLNHTVAVPCRLPKPPLQAPATWILTCPVPSVVADASPCSLALKMWPPPPDFRADAGRPMFASCLLVSPFTESRTNCRPP